jgi:hypothetical protein
MSMPYRVAVSLVALIAALVFVALAWDGFDCQPECYGSPWNCGEEKP